MDPTKKPEDESSVSDSTDVGLPGRTAYEASIIKAARPWGELDPRERELWMRVADAVMALGKK